MQPAAKLAAAARVGDPLNASLVVTEGRNLLIDRSSQARHARFTSVCSRPGPRKTRNTSPPKQIFGPMRARYQGRVQQSRLSPLARSCDVRRRNRRKITLAA